MSSRMSCLIANEVSVIREEHYLLKDISLEIKPATITLILGHNGAGKTLLMHDLHGLTLPDEGVIDSPPASRQRMVFQKPIMLRRTALQYFNFVCPGLSIPDQHHWFDSAQLTSRMDAPARRLSGGEQQRIAIARALLNDPELILADEPTGNLDPQTSVEVMEVLQEINNNGNTILMATHDYALLLKYPSKTLKCDQGQLFEVVQKTV